MTSSSLPWRFLGFLFSCRQRGWCWVAVRLFPPPVNPLFPLPVIRGPAKITLRNVVDKGVCDSCAATLLDAHSKKRRGRPQGCDVDPSLKAGLRTSESRSSQVAVLHDYTASATLLWCVGIITLGHGPPNVGDHVVSGAVAVRDDAIGSKLAAAKNEDEEKSVFLPLGCLAHGDAFPVEILT